MPTSTTKSHPHSNCDLFSLSIGGNTQLTFNGPVYFEERDGPKAEQACRDVKQAVLGVAADLPLRPTAFYDVAEVEGFAGSTPWMRPMPPDAKRHRDFSEVGGGHDGGYSTQCEYNWY